MSPLLVLVCPVLGCVVVVTSSGWTVRPGMSGRAGTSASGVDVGEGRELGGLGVAVLVVLVVVATSGKIGPAVVAVIDSERIVEEESYKYFTKICRRMFNRIF